MRIIASVSAAVLLVLVSLHPVTAVADGGQLTIRATLISCGPTVKKACQQDTRCCGLVDDDIDAYDDDFVDLDISPLMSINYEEAFYTNVISNNEIYNFIYNDTQADGMPVPLLSE